MYEFVRELIDELVHGLGDGCIGATLKRASVLELSSRHRGEGDVEMIEGALQTQRSFSLR